MSHDGLDIVIQIGAITVPIVMTLIFALIAYAVNQSTGRVRDKIKSVQEELTEHKDSCEKIDKNVLESRLVNAETEITNIRKFNHWIANKIMIIAGKLDIEITEFKK